jgi:hypothetical protein
LGARQVSMVTKGKRGTNGVMEQWSNEGKDCWIGGGVE